MALSVRLLVVLNRLTFKPTGGVGGFGGAIGACSFPVLCGSLLIKCMLPLCSRKRKKKEKKRKRVS